MHCSFSATVLTAFSIISAVNAGPIAARQVCGAAPAGTTAQTPLLQPTGIQTASDCATQCKANSSCLSFLFGLVDGADKCELFSVAASAIPATTGLVAYDIGCSSIPVVVPTASNPTGLAQTASNSPASVHNRETSAKGQPTPAQGASTQTVGTHSAPVNQTPAGSPSPIATPTASSLDACLKDCKGNPSCIAYTFENNVCKLFGPTVSRRDQKEAANPAQGSSNQALGTHDSPVNQIPSGSPSPIATPTAASLDACLADCKGNPSCIAYTFENGVCKLFGPAVARRQQKDAATPATQQAATPATQQGTHAAPVNQIPTGSPSPIATPTVNDLATCLAACKGNTACVAYTFENNVCKLFN